MAYFDLKSWYDEIDFVVSDIVNSVNDFMSEQEGNIVNIENAHAKNGYGQSIVSLKIDDEDDTYTIAEDGTHDMFRELPLSEMLVITEYLSENF